MNDAGAVEVRRRLAAPIGEVYRWLTEPERLCDWMSPVGTAEASVDFRVGGALRIVMRGEGRVIEHTGTYLVIEPPYRLAFSWVSPYTGDRPSVVTIQLSEAGEGLTDLLLTHSPLPPMAAPSHRQGWTGMLNNLDDRLRREAALGHAG